MLTSISPVGESARNQLWTVTVVAYVIASLVGGALMGGLTGVVGSLLVGQLEVSGRLLLLGLIALAGLVVDATVGTPTVHRQVDERWLTSYRGWVYGGGFGLQLGTGVATIVPSSVVLALWSATLLTASPRAGVMAGAAFGLLRAVPLVLAGRLRTVLDLRRAMAAMNRVRPLVRRTIPLLQAVVGVALVGVSLT